MASRGGSGATASRSERAGDGCPTERQNASAAAEEGTVERACAEACSRAHVPWQLSPGADAGADQPARLADPTDLLVVGQGLATGDKAVALQPVGRGDTPPVLVCPDSWQPLSRILVLDQGHEPTGSHLVAAAALARGFRAGLVVLTLARSERAARLRQHAAWTTLTPYGLDADFDFAVGSDVGTAVRHVARWRHCQLVVSERRQRRSWWGWSRPTTESLLNITRDLAYLTLPEAAAVECVGHALISATSARRSVP
jgi:hypothetical protein